jgi:hypothetical protein
VQLKQFAHALLIVLLLELLSFSVSICQVTISVRTDKPSYSYGEPIGVSVSVSNNTDSTFSVGTTLGCEAQITFNAVNFSILCTNLAYELDFPPGATRTWYWHLNPSSLGIPDQNGTQTIIGTAADMVGSVQFQAPRYYGGGLTVAFGLNPPPADLQSLRDSIGATVLSSDTLTSIATVAQEWQVVGHTVDSIASYYRNDPRLKVIQVDRSLHRDSTSVTSVPYGTVVPNSYLLSQNYPNPFNPTTNIEFFLPVRQVVQLEVFDLQGQLVTILVNGPVDAGIHKVTFDASKLAGGVYMVRLQTPGFEETRKMIYIK